MKTKWLTRWGLMTAICTVAHLNSTALAQSPVAGTEFGFPTVSLRQLPEPLRSTYMGFRPEMTDRSRCAAAFDPSGDLDKMTLRCSIYIRMAAEGARRAMSYCEEKRQELHIKAPCRIVQE